MTSARAPHPSVWTLLYLPFGAMSGFVGVGLTFMATRSELSIAEGGLLGGALLLSQWLKWLWAPAVDVTLTPKRWYLIATSCSALGVLAMSAVPMSPATLPWLLAIIAVASLINSIVGMAIEAILAQVTTEDQRGRVSAWFQVGNLGGAGLGGGIGLVLLETLPQPWMAGAIMGALFLLCCLGLFAVPDVRPHAGGVVAATRAVVGDLWTMIRSRDSFLAMFLCFLPIGTGAGSGVLSQAEVAARWGAGSTEVAWLQGFVAAGVTAVGCFAGGWLCDRFGPKPTYAGIGLLLSVVCLGMSFTPFTVLAYIGWSMVYSLVVGLAYAAFTAVVLEAIGRTTAATKYNLFASLSNFPIWWLGLLLAWVAGTYGAQGMLWTEAGLGVLGILAFLAATALVRRRPAGPAT
jgi:MFS family permease